MDRWIEKNFAARLVPLAYALAKKKIEHPPDSLKIVQDSMDRLQARGVLPEIRGINYYHENVAIEIKNSVSATADQQIAGLKNLLRGRPNS